MKFRAENGVNIVCLILSAGCPWIALGTLGVPTGAAIALGLLAAIYGQQHASRAVRFTYMLGAIIIRIFSAMLEQMAYADTFMLRKSLPLGITAENWAWITVVFMSALDIWALKAAAERTAAAAEDEELKTSLEREDARETEKTNRLERERAAAEERAAEERIKALSITQETERIKIAAEAAERTATAEAVNLKRIAAAAAAAATERAAAATAATAAATAAAAAAAIEKRMAAEKAERAERAAAAAAAATAAAAAAIEKRMAAEKAERAERAAAERTAATATAERAAAAAERIIEEKRRQWREAKANKKK